MPLKVRFLTKSHTEKQRGRRIIKTKQWKAPSVHGAKEVSFNHIRHFLLKVFTFKIINDLYLHLRRSLCHRHLSNIALPPSTPWLCVPHFVRTLVYHSIFWKPPPHLTNAPHIWCEGLAPHVRRTYNITRKGKTSAGVWWMVRHIGRENWR